MMSKLGMTEDMPLESRMVTRAIEQAQSKVEGHNFDIRKRLVEFDDVINEHRTIIYGERERILEGVDTRDNVLNLVFTAIENIVKPAHGGSIDDLELVETELREVLAPEDVPSVEEMLELKDELSDEVLDRAEDRYEQIEALVGEENMRRVEHWLLLESIDTHWREHLTAIEDLRQSIGLQAYAQIDPLVAFKKEGYDMFQQLQDNIRQQVARTVFKVKLEQQPVPAPAPQPALVANRPEDAFASPTANASGQQPQPQPAAKPVLGRSSTPDVSKLQVNRSDDDSPRGGGGGKSNKKSQRRKMLR
jgi:preprotein translocase subunit SecA